MVTPVTVPEISEGALGGGCSDKTPSGRVVVHSVTVVTVFRHQEVNEEQW